MLEHDRRVLTDERPDVLAESAPLRLVLGLLVPPELVTRGLAVEDRVDTELVKELDLVGRRDDADRNAASVEDVLAGVAAEPTRSAPHQHRVALLHRRAVR